MNQNLPPCNLDAEEAILGCILFNPELIATIKKSLPVEALFVGAHQSIYRSMIYVHKNGYLPNMVNLIDYLNAQCALSSVGGMSQITRILNRTVSATNYDGYVRLLLEKYRRRRLISLGAQIAELARDETLSLDEVLQEIQGLTSDEFPQASGVCKKPIPGKITYTVYSQSRQRKIDLEANVADVKDIKEQIKPLEEHCESTARELWGDELDDSQKSNQAVSDV